MCLYPKLVKNPKYKSNKKNGGNIPKMQDPCVEYVAVGCGNCIECRKQKARAWQVRLNEEIKISNKWKFVTLTFSKEELEKLCNKYRLNECNALAGKAVRLFLERYRKKYGKSLKHWLITELGHEGTERIHIHGLLEIDKDDIEKFWQYGITWCGEYVNSKTINYIIKYVTKIDQDHKNFKQQIFCSAGLGRNFINEHKEEYKYRPNETKEWYTLTNGYKLNLPIYFRNLLFTEAEREKLWIEKIKKEEIYIRGIKYSIKTNEELETMQRVLKKQQEVNEALGFGTDAQEWKQRDYNVTLRMINAKQTHAAKPTRVHASKNKK